MVLNADQINGALQDMYRVFCNLPIEAQEWFVQKTYEQMKGRNNTSFYSLDSFKTIRDLAQAYEVKIENSSILEVGAGKPLGMGLFWNLTGALKYTSIDKFVRVNLDDLWLKRFQSILDMNLFPKTDMKLEDLVRQDGGSYILNRNRIDLIQGVFEDYPFHPESFDFVYSFAVLEHLADITTTLRKMYAILHKEGVMIHSIDLREHHTHLRKVPDKNTSVDFLKYSRAAWERIYPPGSECYINRLRASDFEKLFRQAGFRIIDCVVTQSMDLTDSVYPQIHQEFHAYPLPDLTKLGIRVVLKKA